MFLNWIKIIISLVVIGIIGYSFAACLLRKHRPSIFIFLPLSYGLGIGIISQWMLLLGIMKIPFSKTNVGIPLLVISFVLILWNFKNSKSEILNSKQTQVLKVQNTKQIRIFLGLLIVLLIGILAFKVAYILFQSMNIPVYSWDGIASSAYRAKVIFHQKSLSHIKTIPHPSHPFLIQFAEIWISLNLGQWHEQYVKILFPLFSIGFLLLTYGFIASLTNRIWGLIGCFLLTSSNMFILHSTICYRDIPLMFYLCVAILLPILWEREQDDGYLYLSSLFLGFATFTKLEGSAYFLICSVWFGIFLSTSKTVKNKSRLNKFAKFFSPAFVICMFFLIYKMCLNIQNSHTSIEFTWNHLSRIPVVAKMFYHELFLSGNWSIIWFILILSLIANFKNIKSMRESKFILISLLLFLSSYFIYALLSKSSHELAPDNFSRITLHFFPLAVWGIILLNSMHKIRRN